jgi:cytochrome c oxidase assembly protein subunit 15
MVSLRMLRSTAGCSLALPTPARGAAGGPDSVGRADRPYHRGVRLTPQAYRRITFVAVASLAVIVLTGATVRLTGSGLGCTNWPTCTTGRLTPDRVSDAPAMIEFLNRLVTGVVSVAVIVAVLGSMVRVPRRRDLTLLSWGLVAGVVAQIVLGGLVVLLDLSPRVVMGHFILSMLIVWNAVVLHHRAGRPDGRPVPIVSERVGSMLRLLFAGATLVVLTGTVVTASGPHAGDEQAARLDLVVRDVARIHSIAVWILLAMLLVTLRWLWADGAPAAVRDAAQTLLLVVVLQGAIGYTQYFTGVPALLVGLHIVGALAVWITTIHLNLAASAVPVREREEVLA